MKNPGRMENVTRRLVATLLSLSIVILFASASQAALNCTQCHGDGLTTSLPKDTLVASASYRNITTGAVMGNHETHSGAVAIGAPCARCHSAAAASYTSKHAILKHYSIQISASMNYNKGAGVVTAFPQSTNPTLGTCSTVNCHFQTITPAWGQAVTWASTKGANDNNANCNTCHATTLLTSGAHAKHITAAGGTQASCYKCHPDLNAAVGAAAFKHATSNSGSIKVSFAGSPNGTGSVSAGLRTGSSFLPSAATNSLATCSNTYCHGAAATPAWTGGTTNCETCHDAKNTGLSTRHDIHYASGTAATVLTGGVNAHGATYVYACLNCHPTATHATNPATGVYDAEVLTTGKMSGYTPAGTSLTDAKGFKYSNYGTCTTVCHTRDGVSLAPVVAANWGDVSTGSCTVCHKASGESYTTMGANGATGLSAKHNLHMANDKYGLNTTNYTCATCHAGTATSNTTINGAGGRALHPNANREVSMTAFAGAGAVTIAGVQGSSRTCANTYCHSDGTLSAGTHSPVNWTTGAVLPNCSSCHGGNSTALAANRIKTAVHAQHLYSTARMGKTVGCADCHKATVSSDSAIFSFIKHVDKNVNVKFDNVINKDADAPTYNAIATTLTNDSAKTPGTGGYTCSNVYCHSIGNLSDATGSGTVVTAGGASFRSVGWNTGALGCDGCHGNQAGKSHPVYTTGAVGSTTANSHIAHVESSGYGCDFCHNTTTADTAITPKTLLPAGAHIDRIENVSFKLNGGLTGTYNATVGQKTCSATACHGGVSPKWGANNDANSSCTKCHGKPTVQASYSTTRALQSAPGYSQTGIDLGGLTGTFTNGVSNDAQVGAHDAHLRAVNQYTGRKVLCSDCHTVPSTPITAGHMNGGSAEMVWGNLAKNIGTTGRPSLPGAIVPNYSGGTCSNIYCHGATMAQPSDTSPEWIQTTYLTSYTKDAINCGKCHGAPPTAAPSNSPHGGTAIANACTGCHGHEGNGPTHIDGILQAAGGESGGGSACGGCHSDLFNSDPAAYSMHSDTPGMSYKHYMNNDSTAVNAEALYQIAGTGSYYSNTIPNGGATGLVSRRCLMCHVDHDIFKTTATSIAGRAFNLRDRADVTPTKGSNDDYNLCLSCHLTEKNKAHATPNGNSKVMAIPYAGLTYANATSVLTFSTHGYAVFSNYSDATYKKSTFRAICVKCHNDSIGRNGEGPKSSVSGQKGTYKFGEHNSTIPARFSVFNNPFYQGMVAGAAAGTSVQVTPNPAWALGSHTGHYMVVTGGAGNNQRRLITANTADTVTILSAFSPPLDATSKVDITDDNMSVDNICFSCHSRGKSGEKPFASYSTSDWYGKAPMKRSLVRMKDLFTGDAGSVAALSRKTSVLVTVQNSWALNAMAGYQFKTPGGTRVITTNTVVTGGANTTIAWTGSLNTSAGAFQILKPASHPLDTYGRHDSYERVSATAGWNAGDSGTSVTANSITAATQITDTAKKWSGSEFNSKKIFFPGLFGAGGLPLQSTVTGGGAGTITFSPSVSGLDLAGGDNYYIGTRHVSCADCHNTHATFSKPEGTLTTGGLNPTSLVANSSANIKGWRNGIWTGYLLKLRSITGAEQIRYITAFTSSTGTYTVSLPFTGTIGNTFTYEVLVGDKWTSVGQSGGRAGPGSSGMWGTVITGWRLPQTLGNMTTATGYKKIENVFDNLSTTGLGGSTIAGQRDLCIRCHSSYSFGTATPMTPSGHPNGGTARSTDVSKEFNPNNLAHHAVYARGNNQPIRANYGQTGISSSMNPNWPIYATATNTVTVTSGVASFSVGAALPATALPGWYIYIGSDTRSAITGAAGTASAGYLEITTISSPTSFTVRAENGAGGYNTSRTIAANANWYVTAGLGNNFVPPYGPWSILRCTDCHGSTKTDPVGPHASVNKWLIRDAETLTFQWYGPATAPAVTNIAPGAPSSKKYFCFNCHRADVYLDNASATNNDYGMVLNATMQMSRIPHGADGMEGGKSHGGTTTYSTWGVHCRNCHAGDRVGGIHGTNLKNLSTPTGTYTNKQGKRFLNGAAWATNAGTASGGLHRSTTTVAGGCYVGTSTDTTINSCNSGHSDTGYGALATYDYDNP